MVFTLGSVVLCTPEQDTSSLGPCNHEEADTRMFLHMKDGLDRQGLHFVLIYTVDTDVVALAISTVAKLNNLNLSIAFGTGTHFRYLNVNNLANSTSPDKANVLSIFHAITGCDTISFFAGKGKISAWIHGLCTQNLQKHFQLFLQTQVFHLMKNLLSLNSTCLLPLRQIK